MTEVRLATEDDVPVVVAAVAEAFAHDPAWGFMLGAAGRPAAEAFAHALLMPRLRRGTVWVAAEGAAVAMWDRRTADAPPPEDDPDRWTAFRAAAGEDGWERVEAYEHTVDAAAPARPYWYLGVLATRPSAQGAGLATAVLQPGFDAAASDGWDCWLETSTTDNKAFYERRGFTAGAALQVPDGPPVWWLRRRRPTTDGVA